MSARSIHARNVAALRVELEELAKTGDLTEIRRRENEYARRSVQALIAGAMSAARTWAVLSREANDHASRSIRAAEMPLWSTFEELAR